MVVAIGGADVDADLQVRVRPGPAQRPVEAVAERRGRILVVGGRCCQLVGRDRDRRVGEVAAAHPALQPPAVAAGVGAAAQVALANSPRALDCAPTSAGVPRLVVGADAAPPARRPPGRPGRGWRCSSR